MYLTNLMITNFKSIKTLEPQIILYNIKYLSDRVTKIVFRGTIHYLSSWDRNM